VGEVCDVLHQLSQINVECHRLLDPPAESGSCRTSQTFGGKSRHEYRAYCIGSYSYYVVLYRRRTELRIVLMKCTRRYALQLFFLSIEQCEDRMGGKCLSFPNVWLETNIYFVEFEDLTRVVME
jgi:hypothetical protein